MSPVHVLQMSPVYVLQMSRVHVLQMSPVHVLQVQSKSSFYNMPTLACEQALHFWVRKCQPIKTLNDKFSLVKKIVRPIKGRER